MIYIFSSRKAAALGLSERCTWAEIVKVAKNQLTVKNLKALTGQKKQTGDEVYLDVSGFTPAELKKALSALKKFCAPDFWGIIDPMGTVKDPASLFFEGACDYIGQAVAAKGLNKKLFEAALSWSLASKAQGNHPSDFSSDKKRKGVALPAGKFGGWKSLRVGTTAPFFFLFVSLSGKSNLRSQVGEIGFNTIKKRLRDTLLQGLHEADALLWMENENNFIFLVPPTAVNGRMAVEASLKIILNSRLVSIEKLSLSIPIDFTFALHYGKTVFRAPGKTGAVVSESLNYIFHLGTKKAEIGRLTVSDDVSEDAFPEGLANLFIPAGDFEGIPVRHSKRFVYKP